MSRSRFNLTENPVDDRTHEIRVEGELDLTVADELDRLLEATVATRILIDLQGCDFLDSSGIAVILRANQAAVNRGERIIVHSAQEQVQRILFVTGLTQTGLVCLTREEALSEQVPGDGRLRASS